MDPPQPGQRNQPHILYIDAFDSFANNITGLLQQRLGAKVTLVHTTNSAVDKNLIEILASVDAVVVGPGPGHPGNPNDVGFIEKIWALDNARLLPVFGICLGFQSLCLSHGADVRRLQLPRHGIVARVSHRGDDMFSNLGELEATQYHSLHADIGGIGEDGMTVSWEPTGKCPALLPLAWDEGDMINGPVLMSVRHGTKPFWGVQFHPESICTTATGAELIANWWVKAREWLLARGRTTTNVPLSKWLPKAINGQTPLSDQLVDSYHLAQDIRSAVGPGDVVLSWEKLATTHNLKAAALLDALGYSGEEVVLLDSQGHDAGRFDILGFVIPGLTIKVTYRVSDHTLRYGTGTGTTEDLSVPLSSIDEVWPILQEALDLHVPQNHHLSLKSKSGNISEDETSAAGHLPQDTPFWGGFMGYISYEAGLETIDVAPHTTGSGPDINFAFIHRSIIIDHGTSHVYVQSLLPEDQDWINTTSNIVQSLVAAQQVPTPASPSSNPSPPPDTNSPPAPTATLLRPSGPSYRAKIRECQRYLHSGDSYELCLTDSSTISLPNSTKDPSRTTPWSWYTRLRTANAAPHGAYLHLSGVHVISSSPERFLRWTRNSSSDGGVCEFRPIKGTVKKHQVNGEIITRPEAEAILWTAKERAENLMIVDLIRHDLAGAVGAEKVWVSQLMEVEEFATVWHLVSVVRGRLGGAARGMDVLRRSLPPGSMTGAPKKRSCEILGRIEGGARGVYSGVLGYMDVGGGGDFSVVIRTAVREGGRGGHVWRVGAGGAVTVKSDEEGEFLEMETKASSVLDALRM